MASGGIALLLGLIVGSFLNVCIHRIPRRQSVVHPSSSCPFCRAGIHWYDNIPLLSYIALRGRCRSCGNPISWQYPAVELTTGLLFLAAAHPRTSTGALVFDWIWISLLIVIAVIDLRRHLIPNVLTLPGILLALVARTATDQAPADALLGALVGAGSLLVIAWIYQRVRGVEGIGGGDIKLMAMVGAYLGWPKALLTIFLASFAGSIVGILVARGRGTGLRTPLPFGLFLAAAAVFLLLAGPRLPLPLP